MATKGSKGDAGKNELIRVGANVYALSQIFDRDMAQVKRIIAKQRIPCVVNSEGAELYAIRDIAPFLCDISHVVNIEDVLKSTSLKKLPPELTKNYWDAYNARKKALEDDKQLWRTEAVMEVFVEVFTAFRQAINQFNDTVDTYTKTTPEQRKLITEMTDGLLASVREKLIEKFELFVPEEEERFREPTGELGEREQDEFDD